MVIPTQQEELEAREPLPVRGHCWSWRDFFSVFGHSHPDPIEEPDEDETPERVLRREVAELGGRVLDLRGWKRNKPHPFRHRCVVRDGVVMSVHKRDVLSTDEDFGIWGWFGGGENRPKRGRAHGKIKVAKSTTTIVHTMDVDAGPARCAGIPVQNCVCQETIVLCHSIFARMWAAHAANGYSDSIEIAGKKGAITVLQIALARCLIKYILASKRRNLALIGQADRQLYIGPHALSHWSRLNDCGRKIWDALGRWAIEIFGLKCGPVVGSGKVPKWLNEKPSNR